MLFFWVGLLIWLLIWSDLWSDLRLNNSAVSLKAAKNRFQLSTGSNLETLNTISSGTNLCLSRVSNLNLNSASDLIYFSWKYLCVDEGHRLKNIDCRLVRELKKYNSDHRYIVLYSVQRTAYSVQRTAYSVKRTA